MGTATHLCLSAIQCNVNNTNSFRKIVKKYLGKAAQESFKTWEAEQALLFHGTSSSFGLHTFQPFNEGRQLKEPLRHRLLRMRHCTPSKFGSHPIPLNEHVIVLVASHLSLPMSFRALLCCTITYTHTRLPILCGIVGNPV